MTHLLKKDNPNLVVLNGNTAVYFTAKEDFEKKDTILLQDGRNETRYSVFELVEVPALKKNTVLLNLTKEEI